MPTRNTIRQQAEQEVLLKCKRRCVFCFAEGATEPKSGAIAHIDHSRTDNSTDNLVFLCEKHHLEFDRGETLTSEQAREARTHLYEALAAGAEQSATDPKSLHAYEDRVVDLVRAEISKTLGDCFSLSTTALYPGRSGVSHEVDLAVEFKIAGLRYSTVFEIKSRRTPIGAEDVLRFGAVADDIGANKAVIVSNGPFSAAAVQLARTKGITLAQVRTDSERLEDVQTPT